MLGPKIYVTHFFHFIDWRADGSQCKQKGTFSVVVEEDGETFQAKKQYYQTVLPDNI